MNKKILFRWVGWFFFVNTMLSSFLIFTYANYFPSFSTIFGWIYLVVAFINQISIFYFSAAFFVFLLAYLFPKRSLVISLGIFLSTMVMFILIADRIAFDLYHMHYITVGIQVIKKGAFSQVIQFSSIEWLYIVSILSMILGLEVFIAKKVWHFVQKSSPRKTGIYCSGMLLIFFLLTYGLMFFSFHSSHGDDFFRATRVVPYFDNFYRWVLPDSGRIREIDTSHGLVQLQLVGPKKIKQYPLHTLSCSPPKKPYNILMIVIDTWRYDVLNPAVTPNLYQFSKKTTQYQKHWSGGNSTQPGIFTLFYGLPANYWDAFENKRQGPVLIDQLLKANYQLAIYASAPLTFPAFDNTVFSQIKHLITRTEGDSTVGRDRGITQEFSRFLTTRNREKPFFGFLFYDASHNYCDPVTPSKTPFQPYVQKCDRITLTKDSPRAPYFNRYRNAVYSVDAQIGEVLSDLKKQGLMKNTIIVITGDHAEQFNDERMGYWDHGSAYTSYQLHVPLLVYWPHASPKNISYLTTHYDVAPTLLTQALHCSNPVSDYSIGESLQKSTGRDFLMVSSYADYAVIHNGVVTRIYPNGDYRIYDRHEKPLPSAVLNKSVLDEVYEILNRY